MLCHKNNEKLVELVNSVYVLCIVNSLLSSLSATRLFVRTHVTQYVTL